MADIDWDAPAELYRLDAPPELGSPRTQISQGTLRECLGQFMAFHPAERMDLAVSTAALPLLRKTSIDIMIRRADLGGWMPIE